MRERARERARERKRERAEEQKRAKQAAEWERFMQVRGLELRKGVRKGGQLARLLGEPLPGERLPAALERLALVDQRPAEEGLVALTRGGEMIYKHMDKHSARRICLPGSQPREDANDVAQGAAREVARLRGGFRRRCLVAIPA